MRGANTTQVAAVGLGAAQAICLRITGGGLR